MIFAAFCSFCYVLLCFSSYKAGNTATCDFLYLICWHVSAWGEGSRVGEGGGKKLMKINKHSAHSLHNPPLENLNSPVKGPI